MKGISAEEVRADLRAKGETPERNEELVPHKVHPGNRPTNSILLNTVEAKSLGALIALYEHRIFGQGIIRDVHSYDRWGVGLGMMLAAGIETELRPEAAASDRH